MISEHPKENAVYLLAYPRSGSNWFRYCFEFITKRLAVSRQTRWKTEALFPGLLWHMHRAGEHNNSISSAPFAKNILLLRNYKEAITSNTVNSFGTQGGSLPAMVGRHRRWWEQIQVHDLTVNIPQYYGLIQEHDRLSKNNNRDSHLVYYENFILDPFSTLTKIITYLHEHFAGYTYGPDWQYTIDEVPHLTGRYPSIIINGAPHYHDETGTLTLFKSSAPPCPLLPSLEEMESNLSELMDNFEEHKNICLGIYQSESGLGLSSTEKSSDIFYYSSQLGKKRLLEFDSAMENYNPEIYDKYLSRYKEAS